MVIKKSSICKQHSYEKFLRKKKIEEMNLNIKLIKHYLETNTKIQR